MNWMKTTLMMAMVSGGVFGAEPVACFDFNEVSGFKLPNRVGNDDLTVLYDSVAFDGSGDGPQLIEGRPGGGSAMQFNPGYNGDGPIGVLVSSSRAYDFGRDDFVVSGWFRSENVEDAVVPAGQTPEHRWIFNTARGNHEGIAVGLVRDGINPKGKLQFSVNGEDKIILMSKSRLDDNQWHWFAGVVENEELSLYIDGRLNGAVEYKPKTSASATSDLFIGAQTANESANPFSGDIDDIFVCRGLLSAELGKRSGLTGGELYVLWTEGPQSFLKD